MVFGTGLFIDPRPDLDSPEVPRIVGVLTIPDPVDVAVAEPRNEGEREELAMLGDLDVIFSGGKVSFTVEDIVSYQPSAGYYPQTTFENEG